MQPGSPIPTDRSLTAGKGEVCVTSHSVALPADMRTVGFAALFAIWRLNQADNATVALVAPAGTTMLSARVDPDATLADACAACCDDATAPDTPARLAIVASGVTDGRETVVPRLRVTLASGRTDLSLVHDPSLIAPVSAQDLLEKIGIVLGALAQAPATPCAEVALLTPIARTLLADLSAPLPARQFDPVAATFFAIARAHGGEPAVTNGERTWSYAELARAVRHLAARLDHAGLAPQDVVAIRGRASFGVYAAMLAVLAAGGVLVTLDRSLPPDRQALIARISRPRLRIDVGGPTVVGPANTIAIGEWPTEGELAALGDPPERVAVPAEGAAAYVFFTSGSSGTPKGVLGTHLGLAHFLAWQRESFPLGPGDRMAQLVALSFDPVLRDVLYPLTSGACLHVPAPDMLLDARRMLAWFADSRITAMHCVPSLMKAWMQARPDGQPFLTMRHAFFNGEPLNDRLLDGFKAAAGPQTAIVNLYGPTETTLAKLSWRVERIEPGVQPIGRPQPGVQVAIMRDRRTCCGLWETGEIAIRTPYRSRGYMGNPSLTAEVFVANPWRDDPADLIYFTGDLGRIRADGAVEIFGRRDAQIKIHGVRFEPNEIEAALLSLPGVRDAAVSLREGRDGEKLLVGHIVPDDDCAGDPAALFRSIRSALRLRVVDAMIPGRFALAGVLPHLPNGKLDRQGLKTLPAPPEPRASRRRIADEKLRAFVTGLEDLLGFPIEDTSVSFLELGGDSLSYIRASMLIEDIFGDLPEGWESRPLESFTTRPVATAAATPRAPERRGSGMEMSLLLRAVAITLIVLGHSSFTELVTATSTLFVISGMQFSRFLRPAIRTSGNLRPTLHLIRRFALPAILWQMPRAVWLGTFWWPSFLMMGTFIQNRDEPMFTAWYLDVLAADLLIFAAVAWIGYRFRPAGRTVTDSFRSDLAWVFAGLGVAAGQGLSGWWDGTIGTDSVAPFKWLWMLAFGMVITQANSLFRRLVVSAVLLGLALVIMGGPATVHAVLYKLDASFFVMVALLIWVPRVRLPRLLHEATMTVASATLFIYLLNHSVMTHLMPMLRLPPWWPLQLALSLGIGIAAKHGWDRLEIASRWVRERVARACSQQRSAPRHHPFQA